MKIGIIGAGNIGGTLTRRFRKLGYDVVVANSRDPETLGDLVAETGAKAVSVRDAVRDRDLIVVTIPERNVTDLPKDLLRASRRTSSSWIREIIIRVSVTDGSKRSRPARLRAAGFRSRSAAP